MKTLSFEECADIGGGNWLTELIKWGGASYAWDVLKDPGAAWDSVSGFVRPGYTDTGTSCAPPTTCWGDGDCQGS